MKRYLLAILTFFILTFTAFADGTKQFMPNKGTETNPEPAGYCYIALGSREGGDGPSRAFARYNSTGTSCEDEDRIYIRIADHTKEKIYVGFGGILYDGKETTISNGKFKYGTKELTIKYRIKQCVQDDEDVYPKVDNGYRITSTDGEGHIIEDDLGNPKYEYQNTEDPIVFAERNVPTSGVGYIKEYKEAYYGPNILYSGTKGYNAQEIEVPNDGLYYIEFYIGYNIFDEDDTNNKPIDFKFFDVSVIGNENGTLEQKKGRVYSRAWGLNANGFTNDVWSTFYTYSTDHYTSKVYFSGPMPYRFVFCCNSFGAINDKTVEENRKSYPNPDAETPKRANYIPEYKIFLTSPDTRFYGSAQTPILPKKLQFAGDAMTCEDLIFVMQLAQNESATIELYLNNDGSDENSNTVLIDKLESSKAQKRGYHYPWKDSVYVDNDIRKIKESKGESGGAAGTYYYSPIAEGCTRNYKLSLFDQRFKYNNDTLNVGDSLNITLVEGNIGNWIEPLGSENNPILISTQSELEALAEAVNNNTNYTYKINNFYKTATGEHSKQFTIANNNGFSGIHFYLTAPTGTIKLDDQWIGIGTNLHPFRGTFRCGKYQPDPAHISNTDNGIIGDQDTITFTKGLRGLFNYCEDATIDNIHIKGGFKLDDDESFIEEYFGTICSYAINTNFNNCTYDSYSTSSNAKDSINAKFVSYNVGGIIGYAEICKIDSCYNRGLIYGNKTDGATGGIVASINNSTIKFCFNIGSITQSKGEYAGGIVGSINGGTNKISNCNNQGYIMSGTATGGIVGTVNNGGLTITDCLNNGTIEGMYSSAQTGGIVGATASTNIKLEYCLNTGTVNSPGTNHALCENAYIKNSLSTGTPKQYILNEISTETPTIGENGLSDDHFYQEEDGTIDHLLGTACNGGTWRMEEAGRLYKNDTTFYLNWNGKFDNGECITGSVTINYQKNTGVTHFPFYDPENNWYDETKSSSAPALRRGLVVYRISPIADTITQMLSGTYTDWQTENNKTAEDFGYQKLPKNFYQTETEDDNEYGIEMKLYWDDRNISYSASCNPETITTNGQTYKIGRYAAAKSENILVPSGLSGTKQYCIEGHFTASACKTLKNIQYVENGLLVTKRYCSVWKDKSKPCNLNGGWSFIKTETSTATCYGIENVTESGYYGSEAGGHIFPIHTNNSEGFGNKHIINTWWNGIEVKGINTLSLLENNPAVLMPIVLTRWTATNLSLSVLLEWTTASEENNNYFSIERSVDGVNWERIGKVHGAGTTSMTHSYSFEDTKPISGISYYRLKQTDYNEDYSYSSVICINRPSAEQESYIAYTNAETNTFIVEGNSIAACPIELYDILGHKIYNISFNSISTSKVAINVGKLPAGSYIIKSCNKSKTVVKNW